MDVRTLLKLIKICKQAGVQSLKNGDLEILFATGEAGKQSRSPVEIEAPPTDQELRDAERDAHTADVHDKIDDDLATLQIDDPSQFEELLVQREFDFGEASHDR